MFEYKLRPGYKSKNLLLEFVTGTEDESFVTTLLETFSELDVRISNITDLWMNDEILLDLNSSVGKFILSKDNWDFVFIMADDNDGIKLLDECLIKSGRFKKLDVDFSTYQ